jgi:hypothetical protein
MLDLDVFKFDNDDLALKTQEWIIAGQDIIDHLADNG